MTVAIATLSAMAQPALKTAMAGVDDAMHLALVNETGTAVQYVIRNGDGGWTPWQNLCQVIGPKRDIKKIAIANVNGNVHLVMIAENRVWHTIRKAATGKWDGWGDVYGASGNLNNVSDISVAGMPNGDLHIVALAEGIVWHTIRKETGWDHWGNVYGQTGPISNPTAVSASSMPNGDLHIAAIAGGRVWHTIRKETGWDHWGDVFGQTGPVQNLQMVSTASNERGDLYILVMAGPSPMYAVRGQSGWTRWADINGKAGSVPEPISSAALCYGNGQFQYTIVAGRNVYHCLNRPDGSWQNWGNLGIAGRF